MNYQQTAKTRSICLAALLVPALPLAAAITYVDATHGAAGNTARIDWDGDMWVTSVWNPTTNTENTGGWNQRTTFANNGTIYENAGTNVLDNAHPLLTTVSGLPSDTYDIYVYFWSDTTDGGTWTVRATLDGGEGPWPAFNPSNTPAAVGADFTAAPLITEGNRTMYQAHLGQVTGTSYSVYIDDLPKTELNGIGRTWYDGVGHAVVPEPSSMALAGLGMALMLRRRRQA